MQTNLPQSDADIPEEIKAVARAALGLGAVEEKEAAKGAAAASGDPASDALEVEVAAQESAPVRKAGRPRLGLKGLTQPEREKLINGIGLGLSNEEAWLAAGITRERDELAEQEMKAERAKAKGKLLAEMRRAAAALGNKAASSLVESWLLERCFGLSEKGRVEVTGKDGGPILQLTLAKQLVTQIGASPDVRRVSPAAKTQLSLNHPNSSA